MMQIFLKRSKGSITVLVTLIMVPTIFFNGFLVDLARVKLYGNQAVMTADNYGQTVMTYYDNVLKELYGLFAVTQNEAALGELEKLDSYVKASFNPGAATIAWDHLQGIPNIGNKTEYEGFLPYKSAEVDLTWSPVKGANLENDAVFSTQIGDFMKFRIVQSMLNSDLPLDEILDEISNSSDNAQVIKAKDDFDQLVGELLEETRLYYQILVTIKKYPDFLKSVHDQYNKSIGYGTDKYGYTKIVVSSSYVVYCDYEWNKTAIASALQRQKEINEYNALSAEEKAKKTAPASLSEEEKKYVDMNTAYQNDKEARKDALKKKFNAEIDAFDDAVENEEINFNKFADASKKLTERAVNIQKLMSKLDTKRKELNEMLDNSNVTEKMREEMQESLKKLDSLFDSNGHYSAENYMNLSQHVANMTSVNTDYKNQVNSMLERMNEVKNQRLEPKEENDVRDLLENINESHYQDFYNVYKYRDLYDALEKTFAESNNKEAEKKAKNKKDEANTALKDAQDSLEKEDTPNCKRDIPKSFGFGDDDKGGKFVLSRLINTAASYFKTNSLSQTGEKILLKFYIVEYDFGMFTHRLTNVQTPEEKAENKEHEKEESLTGYEYAEDLNYLYQSELEYIFGGHNSSKENLNEARNKILAFRAVSNIAATYTVREVNSAIKSISDAAYAINPLLGIAVEAALRLAVAGIETAQDWKLLMERDSVALFKNELNDLTSYDTIKKLIDAKEEKTGSSQEIKLSYEDYLLIMLIFLTTSEEINSRTQNLVSLNVNAIEQQIGRDGTLEKLDFEMNKAITAVDATCSVHMDFVVMPQGFAKAVLGDEYSPLEEFQKSKYQFTVTRGY